MKFLQRTIWTPYRCLARPVLKRAQWHLTPREIEQLTPAEREAMQETWLRQWLLQKWARS